MSVELGRGCHYAGRNDSNERAMAEERGVVFYVKRYSRIIKDTEVTSRKSLFTEFINSTLELR